MMEYFKTKYGIDLSKAGPQPLLVSNTRDGFTYLPASVCHEASLPRDFTLDQNRMRNL